MEAIALLLIVAVIFAAAGIGFWAMWRASSLEHRLHPLTPEQQARKRRAYAAIVTPLVIGGVLGVLIGVGGPGDVIAVAMLAVLVLLSAALRHRRTRRRQGDRRPPSA